MGSNESVANSTQNPMQKILLRKKSSGGASAGLGEVRWIELCNG